MSEWPGASEVSADGDDFRSVISREDFARPPTSNPAGRSPSRQPSSARMRTPERGPPSHHGPVPSSTAQALQEHPMVCVEFEDAAQLSTPLGVQMVLLASR